MTRKRLSVTAIRAKYPNPVTASPGRDSDVDAYCVGGAFCRFTGCVLAFPLPYHLAFELERHARVDLSRAEQYAGDIIRANDDGDFERAWMLLDEVLQTRR